MTPEIRTIDERVRCNVKIIKSTQEIKTGEL